MKKELMKIVRGFRKGILNGETPHSWCYMVCAPLVPYLHLCGYPCELTEGRVKKKYLHYWITLPDGKIVDPTASQFTQPGGGNMPVIYYGEKPYWYRVNNL
jgi:hypothetical protein